MPEKAGSLNNPQPSVHFAYTLLNWFIKFGWQHLLILWLSEGFYLDFSLKCQPRIHLIMVWDLLIASGLFLIQTWFCHQNEVCTRSLCGSRWIQKVSAPLFSLYVITLIVIITHQHGTLRNEMQLEFLGTQKLKQFFNPCYKVYPEMRAINKQ